MNKSKRKQKLREELLKRRSSIPKETYLQKSAQIRQRLRELPEFRKAHTVHCYVSINDRREVNTHPLIKNMISGKKQVVVPVTEIKKGALSHVHLNSFEDLKTNRWGVLEPKGGLEVEPDMLDLVIVPMVGGDRSNNRIGYGKGFYDRFLAETNCPKIGLLFEECLVEEVPTEPFDVKLDKLITENGIRS